MNALNFVRPHSGSSSVELVVTTNGAVDLLVDGVRRDYAQVDWPSSASRTDAYVDYGDGREVFYPDVTVRFP